MATSFYASAEFIDSDAGSGDQTIEPMAEIVDLRVALDNVLTATSNFIENDTEDYLAKIREFKNNLKNLCILENLKLLDDFVKPDKEDSTVAKLLSLSNSLSSEEFNPYSTDIIKNILIDLSGANTHYNDDLGCDYDTFKNSLMNLNKNYLKSLDELFRADGDLNDTFNKIETTCIKINRILNLELNDASSELYVSLSKYIHSTFSKFDLKGLFDKFINSRRKFMHFRALILARESAVIKESGPLCSICLNESVTHALVSCGHTYCNDCSKKQILHCYICRCGIRERIKIYLN
jgi:hypothetical protein